VELALLPQRVAQVVAGFGEVGAEPDGLAAVAGRFLRLVKLQQQLAEVAAGLGQGRVQLQGLAEGGQRPDLVALEPQGVAQVVVDHGGIGPEPQRLPELGDRGRPFALGLQDQAQIVGGLGVVGLEPQRQLAAAGGPVQLSECPVGFGQIAVEGGRTRVDGDGPADQLDRPRRVALLEGRDAQQVQRVRVIRLAGQDALVTSRSLLQTTALMIPQCGAEIVLDGRSQRTALIPRRLHHMLHGSHQCVTLFGGGHFPAVV
jgi:hypothetical protein